jgi:transcriptional regulator with XRE-family HTH domain
MDIARRLRELREHKDMSQGDIEEKTGLLRCYISRVENGHTVPAIETLEKIAQALDLPLYALLYEGKAEAQTGKEEDEVSDWASNGKGARQFRKLRHAVARISVRDRNTLMGLAEKVSARRKRSKVL